jgi:quercetin dioxygenase-like cupin family protein
VIGAVTVSRLLGGEETAGELSLVELRGLPGSGPGPHLDPWRESFFVLDGELTFRFERDGAVQERVAGPGDSFSVAAGVGHAFTVTSDLPSRYLIASTPAGIDSFFADAGTPIERADLPAEPRAFDRKRLLAAFAKHAMTSYEFSVAQAGPLAGG